MDQMTWIGRSLSGRYQIETLLGQGGMSAVYKATDPNLKRVVAIKLIHSHLSSDSQFIQRFEEEAAAVASLRHPNIVQVYDFNSDQGVHYMVLEFVPGETLQSRLQRLNSQGRKLPLEEAIKYTINICDALGYAHQRGIIHRDIKPANIMLDVNGQAILMDFGIVKIMGNTSHTATGAVLGTASYISPELIRSEQADPRSDIYSLGITLYEMLSGQTPFKADSAMTMMMMHLNDPVPDPRALRADLPASLVNVLLKSLEKNRANRYQNVAELAEDLKNVMRELNGGPVAQTQYSRPAETILTPQPVAPVAPRREVTPPPYVPQREVTPPPYNPQTGAGQPSQSYTPPPPSRTTGYSQQYTMPPAPAAKKPSPFLWLFGLGGVMIVFVVLVAAAGLFLMSRRRSANLPAPTATVVAQAQIDTPQPVAPPTSPPPTDLPAATATTQLVAAPPAATDTPALPPLYAQIDSITISGNQYVVQYETMGFTEKLPWMHVHFFFNTVSPDQAGNPGSGPWVMYGGPRPFKSLTLDKRPEGATQLCILVANANHTVIPESGNCMDLPVP